MFILVSIGLITFVANLIVSGWDFKNIAAVIYASIISFFLGFFVHKVFFKPHKNFSRDKH